MDQATGKTPSIFPWLLAELAIGALALALTALLRTEIHQVARAASALALVSGLISLAAVHIGCNRAGSNGLLAGIAVGFLVRMILLGLGLVGMHARSDDALAYAFTFFAVFALTQGTEIAYVFARSRKSRPARAGTLAASTTR